MALLPLHRGLRAHHGHLFRLEDEERACQSTQADRACDGNRDDYRDGSSADAGQGRGEGSPRVRTLIKKGWSAVGLIFFGAIALQLVWGIIQPLITTLAVGFLVIVAIFTLYRVTKAIMHNKNFR